MTSVASIRLLLVGAPGSEFRLAAEMAREAGAEVVLADGADQALVLLRSRGADLAMIDVAGEVADFISRARAERFSVPVLACGIDAPADKAVAAIRAGARDYVPLPPQRDLIAAAIGTVIEEKNGHPIGSDPALERAVALGLAMARSSAPMLIEGEAGSGREILGRAIHAASGRTGRFIAVEVNGLAPEVVESELFGQDAGAFPGAAASRRGAFEQAEGGTVFIREVAALNAQAQARLCRVLQEHAVRRTGSDQATATTARVMVSTACDLQRRVGDGCFRADLFARLGLARLAVPPLRERRGDMAALAEHFAHRFSFADGVPDRPITEAALAAIAAYGWPGNVRELEDLIHRAVLLADGDAIGPDNLLLADGTALTAAIAPHAANPLEQLEGLVGRTVEEVERALILQTLGHCHGNRTSASSILGISVRTMRNKLRSFIEAGIPVVPAASHDR